MKHVCILICLCFSALLSAASTDLFNEPGVRLKDLIDIAGERDNQLIGFGVVVGLKGTGDKGEATIKLIRRYLARHQMQFSETDISSKNMALVSVTAELPHDATEGSRLHTRVSTVGDCKSLRGGELLQTPLIAADDNIYAVAQGQISIGGYGNSGPGVLSTGVDHENIETVGVQLPGAIVEREVPRKILYGNAIRLNLKQPDYTTASRIAQELSDTFGAERVVATNSSSIHLKFLQSPTETELTNTIAQLHQLRVEPDMVAKVVINPRTGTVVVGKDVKISQIAVSHAGLSLKVLPRKKVQRDPENRNEVVETIVWEMPKSTTEQLEFEQVPEGFNASEKNVPGSFTVMEGTTVEAISNALNALGARPRDIVAVFQAIHAAGALHAKLEIL